ncbi:unnamed protein product [Lepeophtheirus salmonis]|uniref:(salmon louse) hypothetical protein n=1 Tax=Lepeophtheirus salmonis TaxID=72036 RepID=A0A7R8CRZ2_LEPSM|nr:unnamed protein product [Lepeophtheirus salmonis]CAF2872535.1 unnamed protein product [Lepeophtheirus salmonis]
MTYNFILEWQKGKDHAILDVLFRSPVIAPDESSLLTNVCKTSKIFSVKTTVENVYHSLINLENSAKSDENYSELKRNNEEYNVTNSTNPYDRQFLKLSNRLSIDGEFVFKGQKLVIPTAEIKKKFLRPSTPVIRTS